MKYLLDTCLLSELVRPAPHPAVLDWMGERSSSDLYVSALTLAELERGIVRLPASRRRNELTTWLANVQAGLLRQHWSMAWSWSRATSATLPTRLWCCSILGTSPPAHNKHAAAPRSSLQQAPSIPLLVR